MKRILALAVLLAAASGLCCSAPPQPVQNPGIKAHLHPTLAGHSEVVWRLERVSPSRPTE